MKRARLALALALLMLGTLVPCNALCTGAHRQSAHACCQHTSHAPQVKACCAPRPAQQSAILQPGQLPSAVVHLLDVAPSGFVAHISDLAHAHPIPFPPDAAPAPPLVLRT